MNNQDMVKEFHEAFNLVIHPDSWKITSPYSKKQDANRVALITEECAELAKAYAKEDLENVVKELADILYVVYGAAVELGFNLDEAFKIVHESNMSKKDGHPDKSGKWIKGPSYKKPDLSKVIATCTTITPQE